MTSWKRITFVVIVLVGGTMAFSQWSLNQFNNSLSDLEKALTANILNSSLSKKTASESIPLETPEIIIVSTDETSQSDQTIDTEEDIPAEEAASVVTPAPTTTKPATNTYTDLKLSFTFPKKAGEIYTGCTYPISWQSSTVVNLLEITLIDAGTRQSIGPNTGGLLKENTIAKDMQSLNWTVGNVWPGSYYIKVLEINNTVTDMRSNAFKISNIPKGTSIKEIEKICKESGGLF